MTPLVSNLWPQFMVDPAFAACFGQVIVEHAQMLRQERQVIFTLRSSAPRHWTKISVPGCWHPCSRIMRALSCASRTCLAMPCWTKRPCAI